jgi:hypothetical protein
VILYTGVQLRGCDHCVPLITFAEDGSITPFQVPVSQPFISARESGQMSSRVGMWYVYLLLSWH